MRSGNRKAVKYLPRHLPRPDAAGHARRKSAVPHARCVAAYWALRTIDFARENGGW